LASRAGIKIGIIKTLELGKSWPSAENLEKILNALRVPLSILLTKEPAIHRPSSQISVQEELQAVAALLDDATAKTYLAQINHLLAVRAEKAVQVHKKKA
jgi:transcriptional regulator with XRE-family HTH domain